MKKINYLILASTVLLFFACENASNSGGGVNSQSFPENTTSYTLPKDCNRIDFPASYAGKKAYVIYTNTSAISQLNTQDGVNSSIANSAEEETPDSLPSMKIYKGVIDMGDGFYRDEVQFNYTDLSEFKNNSRSAGVYASYNSALTGDLSVGATKPFWVTSEGGQNTDSTQKTFTLKANGTHCRIWAYNNNTSVVNVDDDIFNWSSLANAIDDSYNKITAICGSNAYNGGTLQISATSATKLEVLVYDLFHDATSS